MGIIEFINGIGWNTRKCTSDLQRNSYYDPGENDVGPLVGSDIEMVKGIRARYGDVKSISSEINVIPLNIYSNPIDTNQDSNHTTIGSYEDTTDQLTCDKNEECNSFKLSYENTDFNNEHTLDSDTSCCSSNDSSDSETSCCSSNDSSDSDTSLTISDDVSHGENVSFVIDQTSDEMSYTNIENDNIKDDISKYVNQDTYVSDDMIKVDKVDCFSKDNISQIETRQHFIMGYVSHLLPKFFKNYDSLLAIEEQEDEVIQNTCKERMLGEEFYNLYSNSQTSSMCSLLLSEDSLEFSLDIINEDICDDLTTYSDENMRSKNYPDNSIFQAYNTTLNEDITGSWAVEYLTSHRLIYSKCSDHEHLDVNDNRKYRTYGCLEYMLDDNNISSYLAPVHLPTVGFILPTSKK